MLTNAVIKNELKQVETALPPKQHSSNKGAFMKQVSFISSQL